MDSSGMDFVKWGGKAVVVRITETQKASGSGGERKQSKWRGIAAESRMGGASKEGTDQGNHVQESLHGRVLAVTGEQQV